MEDNNNYTYTYRRDKKKEQQRLRLIALAVFGILVLFCIIFGIISGRNAAKKAHEAEVSESVSVSESESAAVTDVPSTEAPSPFKTGEYVVETGGYSLKFRKDHSTEGDVYLEIQDTTKLTISEIYHDKAAKTSDSGIEYWGKTTYKGYTGWVAMNYLKKAYSENIVTPDEMSSSSGEVTTAVPESTKANEENTTAPNTEEPTTKAPDTTNTPATEPSSTAAPSSNESTTAASDSKYAPGDYVVDTGSYSLTFRKTASRSGEVILSIENGARVTVTKVVTANDSDNPYWGEISYKGHTGYVSMTYLKPAN